jgi:hypothetical protein
MLVAQSDEKMGVIDADGTLTLIHASPSALGRLLLGMQTMHFRLKRRIQNSLILL